MVRHQLLSKFARLKHLAWQFLKNQDASNASEGGLNFPSNTSRSRPAAPPNNVSPAAPPINIRKVSEDASNVSSLLGLKYIRDVATFPSEILESEEKLFELFEDWMIENNREYLNQKEKMRRFQAFKDTVFFVHKENSTKEHASVSVNSFADHLPSDPFVGFRWTEKQGERWRRVMDPHADA